MYLSYQCAHSLKILKYFQIGKKTEIEWHMVNNITNQSYIKLYSLLEFFKICLIEIEICNTNQFKMKSNILQIYPSE